MPPAKDGTHGGVRNDTVAGVDEEQLRRFGNEAVVESQKGDYKPHPSEEPEHDVVRRARGPARWTMTANAPAAISQITALVR